MDVWYLIIRSGWGRNRRLLQNMSSVSRMEQISGLLLLLFCVFPTMELNGATVSQRFTPSQPESTTVHAMNKNVTITTNQQSSVGDPRTAMYTPKHGNRQETPISSMSKSMNQTNATSAVQMNTSHTTPLFSTISSPSDAHQTDLTERWNRTAMTTAKATLSAGTTTTQRFSSYATSENPKPTTVSTLGYVTTRMATPQKQTTKKSTTSRIVHPDKPKTPPAHEQPNETHGIVAAIIIGLILFMMFVGIIFILVKKHKWQRRQLENSEWAGPSPFLDGSAQPHFSRDQYSTRQESKRISIAGFLPQKRQSLLHDVDEGLDMDILPGTTFGQSKTPETKAANGTSHEVKEEIENTKDLKSTESFSENLQMTTEAANQDPNPTTTVMKEDSTDTKPNESPSAKPPPATTSTDIPPPPPDEAQPPSGETPPAEPTPAPEAQIPPAPPLP